MQLFTIEVPRATKYGPQPKPIQYYVDNNGCHICVSHNHSNTGYPRMIHNNKQLAIIRYLYQVKNGPITSDVVMRHKCDNPNCINMEHIEPGTHADNCQDRHKRGRDKPSVGSKNGSSKLTEEQVIEVKKNPQFSYRHFAKKFGVFDSTIQKIRNGETWKHIQNTELV